MTIDSQAVETSKRGGGRKEWNERERDGGMK